MATVNEIVSLDALKFQIGYPNISEPFSDAYLNAKIKTAASWLSNTIKGTLIDNAAKEFRVQRPADDECPVVVRERYLNTVSALAYWTSSGSLAKPADGGISEPMRVVNDGYVSRVYPPPDTGRWPEVLEGSELVLTGSVGIPSDHPDLPGISEMAMLAIEALLTSEKELDPTKGALGALMSKYAPAAAIPGEYDCAV